MKSIAATDLWLPEQHDQRCPARNGGECAHEGGCKPARVHVMREHSARPGAFRLVCGASQREEAAWVLDIDHVAEPGRWGAGGQTENDFGAVNCPTCLAVLAREARVTA